MGIVVRQSFKNIIFTYIGFFIGAINTLFLFTHFLSQHKYGLVSYILSVSNILTPILSFGVSNSFIKFYTSYSATTKNSFASFMLVLPLFSIFAAFLVVAIFQHQISSFISRENATVGSYLWSIFILSCIMAYFEVFYSWARVNLRTVEGNFLKEVFPRLSTLALLILISFNKISFDSFVNLLILSYLIRTIIMLFISLKIKPITISITLPPNPKSIITYSLFLILASTVSSLFMDIDKVMLNQYISLNLIATYTVSVFIASVISVPSRSFYQIISPFVAKNINEKNYSQLKNIFNSGTNIIFFISSLIFMLIILNLNEFYYLIPSKSYSQGAFVVLVISIIKILDSLTSMSNAVLLNTSYYKTVLYLGILLVLCMVGLNLIFIPLYGINGCAIASLISFFIYNLLKVLFVYKKENLQPISYKIIGIFILNIFVYIISFLIPNVAITSCFNAVLFIIIRSLLVICIYVVYFYYFNGKNFKSLTNI